jgi:SAM-dependent methyltransferase
MSGWTFEFEPRPLSAPPPWDYERRARELLQRASKVLDMGTGGGEVFGRLLEGQASRAVATEAWAPNVPVAARNLQPSGVAVVQADSLRLPFAGGVFDLILNRHEELDPTEVAAVLAPGGILLTQQIHPDWWAELRQAFPRMTRFEPHHETYPDGLRRAGLTVVDFRQHKQRVACHNLGEIVYTLAAAPWTVPNFDVAVDIDALLEVERSLSRPEGIVLTDWRYILEARKAL